MLYNIDTTEVYSNETTFLFDTSIYNGRYKFYIQNLDIYQESCVNKIDKDGTTYMIDTVNRTYFTADTLVLKEIQKTFLVSPPKNSMFCSHDYAIRIYRDNMIYKNYLINSRCNYLTDYKRNYFFDGNIIKLIEPKIIEQDSIRLTAYKIY